MHAEKHTPQEKKKFLAKALDTERRSNELRVFWLCFRFMRDPAPLSSEIFLFLMGTQMPRIWMNIEE